MKWLRLIVWRLVGFFRRDAVLDDIEAEMRSHVEMEERANLARGMKPEEARAAARRSFGDLGRMREKGFEIRGGGIVETLWQDLRYSARLLAKKPGFTLLAGLTLALGIGANTAIYSVVQSVVLRPLPYQDPEQLVMIWGQLPQVVAGNVGASVIEYLDYRNQSSVYSAVAAYTSTEFNLTGVGEPEQMMGTLVSASLFPLLNVTPALGRIFLDAEDRPGSEQVVILSHRLWQRRFGSDPSIIGRSVTLNGRSHTVVGVMPVGFHFGSEAAQLWRPIAFSAVQMSEDWRGSRFLSVIARLKPGVAIAQAQAEMAALAERLRQEHPTIGDWGVSVVSLHDEIVGEVRQALLIMFGAVGCVLLIACANVANLLLARASTRHRELAIRAALGAGRGRLIRQLLTESLLLALIGGSAGILLAAWGIQLLVGLETQALPRILEIGIDGRALAFTLLSTLVTGMLFGSIPAWQSAQIDLNTALKQSANRGAAGEGRHRLRRLLVAGEIAIALVLLIGAGLLVKSLYRLQRVELGLDPNRVLTFRLALPSTKYPEPYRQREFYRQLLDRLAAQPGVKSAGAINFLPLSGTGNQRSFLIEGKPEPKINLDFRMVSPDYFRTLGIQARAGRLIDARDRENMPRIAIVNETFVRIFFAAEDPLGKRIKLGSASGPFPWLTIAGVIGDIKHRGLDREVRPEMYVPYLQPLLPDWNLPPMFVVVRGDSEPASLIADVRRMVRGLDRDQPVYSIATMDQLVSRSIAPRRFNMTLLAIFAGLALILAAVGVYGVIASAVAERTREIGIRMALGARTGDVLRMVIKQGLKLIVIGVAVGIAASLALTRVLQSLLFEVSAIDPWIFVGVTGLLMLIALLAIYIPARRATKVDPLVSLKCE